MRAKALDRDHSPPAPAALPLDPSRRRFRTPVQPPARATSLIPPCSVHVQQLTMNALPLLYAAQAVPTERTTIDRIQASLNNLSSSQTQLDGTPSSLPMTSTAAIPIKPYRSSGSHHEHTS